MAMIRTINKYSSTLVGIISIGLILLLVGSDTMRFRMLMANKRSTTVGTIAGQTISLPTYQTQIERVRRSLPPHINVQDSFIRAQAWHQLVVKGVYQKECDMLGITVGEEELVDMVQGEHIYPALQTAFQDPETKKFDKQRLVEYLQHLPQMPEEQRALWYEAEYEMTTTRKHEKIHQLMEKSVFITDLEASAYLEFTDQRALHIRYIYIPYYTYPDDTAPITEAMLKDYLNTHKSKYHVEAHRCIQYITFPIVPTQEERGAFEEDLTTLKVSFMQAEEALTFAKHHTDGEQELSHLKLITKKLPKALAAQHATLKKGNVVGPVREGDVYRLYKIVEEPSRLSPVYEVAMIEKRLVPGDQTHDHLFKKADYCARTIKDKVQLAAYAAQESLQIQEAQVGKNDTKVGNINQARDLVRWLYNDAKVGQVSPVFELHNAYIVAIMTQETFTGVAPLTQVRDQIKLSVRNEQKARAIIARLEQLTGETLAEKANAYGQEAKILEVERLRFGDDTLKSAGRARKAIGAAFALYPGACTIIAEDNGVLVIELIAEKATKTSQGEATPTLLKKLRRLANKEQHGGIFEVLKTSNPVEDERYRLY